MCSVSQILEVPGPDGPLHITSQQEVEQHLSEALALFSQLTAHSPFLVDPLHYELGLLGTSPAAQAILHGTYQCPAEVDDKNHTILVSLGFVFILKPLLPVGSSQ